MGAETSVWKNKLRRWSRWIRDRERKGWEYRCRAAKNNWQIEYQRRPVARRKVKP